MNAFMGYVLVKAMEKGVAEPVLQMKALRRYINKQIPSKNSEYTSAPPQSFQQWPDIQSRSLSLTESSSPTTAPMSRQRQDGQGVHLRRPGQGLAGDGGCQGAVRVVC